MRYGFVIATFGIVLAFTAASAAEVAEAELTWEREWVPGSFLRFENLVGSITVDGASDPGVVRVRARVLAEAEEADEARALAESIALEVVEGEHGPTVRPTWPTDRATAFRPPTSEAGGFMSRMTSWVSSHVRKRTVAVEWNGRSVEVGDVKGGTELAVHVHVSIPLDSVTEFRQVLGYSLQPGVRGRHPHKLDGGTEIRTTHSGILKLRS